MIHQHIFNLNALWSAHRTHVVSDDLWGAVAFSGKRRQVEALAFVRATFPTRMLEASLLHRVFPASFLYVASSTFPKVPLLGKV